MNFVAVQVRAWWHCFMPGWMGHMKNQRQVGSFEIKEEMITAKALQLKVTHAWPVQKQ